MAPKAWGHQGGGPPHPPRRLERGQSPASPPTHQALARLAARSLGQPRGQDLPSNRPDPHFPQPTHPHGWAPLFPQPCQALASHHQADFWGAQTLC